MPDPNTTTPMEPLNAAEIEIVARADRRAIELMHSVTSELCIHYWRELAELRGQLEGANLRADDAHLSCIAAEEERELLRRRHAAGVIEGMWMAAEIANRLHDIPLSDSPSGQDRNVFEITLAMCEERIRAQADRLAQTAPKEKI